MAVPHTGLNPRKLKPTIEPPRSEEDCLTGVIDRIDQKQNGQSRYSFMYDRAYLQIQTKKRGVESPESTPTW